MTHFQADTWEFDDEWKFSANPGGDTELSLEEVGNSEPELHRFCKQLVDAEGALQLQMLQSAAGQWDGTALLDTTLTIEQVLVLGSFS